jgi:hypothetical protein
MSNVETFSHLRERTTQAGSLRSAGGPPFSFPCPAALELALYEFERSRSQSSNAILDSAAAFFQMPLQTQITMVALSVGEASTQDIEHTIKAIKMRNDVIHEGWDPTENAKDELAGLLRTVSTLLPGPRFRFPQLHSGNTLAPEEKWRTIPS